MTDFLECHTLNGRPVRRATRLPTSSLGLYSRRQCDHDVEVLCFLTSSYDPEHYSFAIFCAFPSSSTKSPSCQQLSRLQFQNISMWVGTPWSSVPYKVGSGAILFYFKMLMST
ncbi:hypothetical protein FRC02_011653 [Tulasnella sp. 418]|nr:hypothetical protein FRC02_011653 [Tulasnella sp. 418]